MKVAYLTTCFGTQSHTFIRREVWALRNTGVAVSLYGVRPDKNDIASDALPLVKETHYIYPIKPLEFVRSNLKYFAQSPLRYLKGAITALTSKEFSLKRRAKMLYHYFLAATFAEHMKRDGITHIHAHFMNVSASISMYASYHSKIPFSVTVHSAGTYKTPYILGVDQKLKSAQFLIMISHFNVDYCDAIVHCRDKSHVVRCGMDLVDFKYRGAQQTKPQAPTRLLGVGRFVEKKGFKYLIEAAHILRERGMQFTLTLIGDGPLAMQLKQLVDEYKVNDIVVFTGQRTTAEVRKTMLESDIVIVPSVTSETGEKEGLPVVIMEAMATGVPVVASAHSGIPEIVLPEKTGYLTPEKDAQAIADAIYQIVQHPSPTMIENAYQLVDQSFNIHRIAEQRLALFSHYHITR